MLTRASPIRCYRLNEKRRCGIQETGRVNSVEVMGPLAGEEVIYLEGHAQEQRLDRPVKVRHAAVMSTNPRCGKASVGSYVFQGTSPCCIA